MAQWFMVDILGNVPYGEVDQVCLFVAKQCELGLVQRYNHRDDYSPQLVSLKSFLKMEISKEFHIITELVPECSTTSHPCTSRYRSDWCAHDLYSVVLVEK